MDGPDPRNDSFLWWCEHGNRRHTCVHEAGHAVAAMHCKIPIVSLTIHPEPSIFDGAQPGETASGVVRIDIEALAALRASGTVTNHALFTFALAGESAEKVLLGHETPRGAAKDVREFWAWTKGQTFTSMDEYEEVLGEPFDTAQDGVLRWVRDRAHAIAVLAHQLDAGRVTVDELRTIAGATDI